MAFVPATRKALQNPFQGSGATTGPDGLAFLEVSGPEPASRIVVARRGRDLAFLPEGPHNPYHYWGKVGSHFEWCVFDDRGLYHPGEEVELKGWVRHSNGHGGLPTVPQAGDRSVTWMVESHGHPQAPPKGSPLHLDEEGGFHLRWRIPKGFRDHELGFMFLIRNRGELRGFHTHRVQVADFVRPEFRVELETPETCLRGETLSLAARAHYYSGGALSDSEISWRSKARRALWEPADWPCFHFGPQEETSLWTKPKARRQECEGRTDREGLHIWEYRDPENLAPGAPLRLSVEARVKTEARLPLAIEGPGATLEVRLSTTLLRGLCQRVRELQGMWLPCTLARASRLLGTCSVLASPAAAGLKPRVIRRMKARARRDLESLAKEAWRGFPRWSDGPPDPYLALLVSLAVVQAARANLKNVERLGQYCTRALQADPPESWEKASRLAWKAGAAGVLGLLGQEPVFSTADPPLSLDEAAFRLALGASSDLLQETFNRLALQETVGRGTDLPGTLPDFPPAPSRAPALLLALGTCLEENLAARLAKGLLEVGGRGTGHDLAWALYGLAAFSRRMNPEPTSGEVEARAGESTLLKRRVTGPCWSVARKGPISAKEVHLARRDGGPVFYQLRLRQPEEPGTLPLEEGLTVERCYEDEYGRAFPRRADGWRIPAGSRVRVKLTLIVPAVRSEVLLVDAAGRARDPGLPWS
ncbi:MAG: hypothetical protein ACOX9B_13840 [Candidatus Xenobium sp.]